MKRNTNGFPIHNNNFIDLTDNESGLQSPKSHCFVPLVYPKAKKHKKNEEIVNLIDFDGSFLKQFEDFVNNSG